MRAFLMALVTALSAPAWCGEDIAAVLTRSQQQQLDALHEVEQGSLKAQVIRRSFDRLLMAVDVPVPVSLLVVDGPQLAECLLGRVVVANASLAEMSEGERMFVLAHELGHVVQGHWSQMRLLFQKHIPHAVQQEHTDAVAGVLGREASQLAHLQEYEADAFAVRVLQRLGEAEDSPLELFRRLPMTKDTATHPGTHRRVMQIRVLLTD